ARVTECVMPIINRYQLSILSVCAFGDYYNGIARVLRVARVSYRVAKAFSQAMKDLLIAERMLWYENQMRLSRHAGPEREMACVPTHHFNYLNPAVRACRSARAFYNFSDVSQSRVEAERVIRSGQILVNRLRNAYNSDAFFRQLRGNSQSVFAAADDQSIKLKLLYVRYDFA